MHLCVSFLLAPYGGITLLAHYCAEILLNVNAVVDSIYGILLHR